MNEDLLSQLQLSLPVHEVDGMRPGASAEQIEGLERRLRPRALSLELRELFAWHDGSLCDFDDDVPLFGFRFLSIDESFSARTVLEEFEWASGFMPIGVVGGSMILATLGDVDKQVSQLYQCVTEDGQAFLLHQSIKSLLETALHVWTTKAAGNQSLDDVRRLYSPSAYVESQKGSRNGSGIQNVFSFDEGLPTFLI